MATATDMVTGDEHGAVHAGINPRNLKLTRKGNALWVTEEGETEPRLSLEDYLSQHATPPPPQLPGVNEDTEAHASGVGSSAQPAEVPTPATSPLEPAAVPHATAAEPAAPVHEFGESPASMWWAAGAALGAVGLLAGSGGGGGGNGNGSYAPLLASATLVPDSADEAPKSGQEAAPPVDPVQADPETPPATPTLESADPEVVADADNAVPEETVGAGLLYAAGQHEVPLDKLGLQAPPGDQRSHAPETQPAAVELHPLLMADSHALPLDDRTCVTIL